MGSLAQLVEHVTADLRAVCLSPMLDVEITKKWIVYLFDRETHSKKEHKQGGGWEREKQAILLSILLNVIPNIIHTST